jgi:DNA mismatch endonuclease (patch repair protein)
MSTRWNDAKPPVDAWRPARRLSPADRAAEQDQAAGGRAARERRLDNGQVVHASVCLRIYAKTRRIRAYLRWSDQGKTRERYIGEVRHATRAENLNEAWARAHSRDLLAPNTQEDPCQEPTSWATSPAVRAVMRANRSRDTRPETRIRSRLHAMGLRYRVSQRPIPELRRTADVVFRPIRLAVFIDGCYWHGCPDHHRPARINSEFWRTKIEVNRQRDSETDRLLTEAGWHVIRVWEHEPAAEAADRIARAVRAKRGGGRPAD